MGEAYFYHMTRTPLEETLPALLGRAREAGWRVRVAGREAARLDLLDRKLWERDGFLPHGRAGGPHDADQPILLVGDGESGENGATCLVSVDGAGIEADAITASDRAMVLFDGNDPDAVQRARDQWKAITNAGVVAKYWSQETGKWALKASSG